jgi:hypothetical protein
MGQLTLPPVPRVLPPIVLNDSMTTFQHVESRGVYTFAGLHAIPALPPPDRGILTKLRIDSGADVTLLASTPESVRSMGRRTFVTANGGQFHAETFGVGISWMGLRSLITAVQTRRTRPWQRRLRLLREFTPLNMCL